MAGLWVFPFCSIENSARSEIVSGSPFYPPAWQCGRKYLRSSFSFRLAQSHRASQFLCCGDFNDCFGSASSPVKWDYCCTQPAFLSNCQPWVELNAVVWVDLKHHFHSPMFNELFCFLAFEEQGLWEVRGAFWLCGWVPFLVSWFLVTWVLKGACLSLRV